MMKSFSNLILLFCIGTGLVFLGCGKSDILTPYPDGKDGLLYAVGVGKSRDLRMAKSLANQRARASIVLAAQAHATALAKDFQQQLGAGATGQINAAFTGLYDGGERLIGSKIIKTKVTEKNGFYNVQMMLGMPMKDSIDAQLEYFQAWKAYSD